MENFLGDAIILEAALASVLLALWMTWLAMRGLFLLMPAKAAPIAERVANSSPLAGRHHETTRHRQAA
jgi:hypothetical protein